MLLRCPTPLATTKWSSHVLRRSLESAVEALDTLARRLTERGIETSRVPIETAAHSRLPDRPKLLYGSS